jgi:hypothetical protein
MSELSGQLLATRIQNLAGEAAGHSYESALCEYIDNSMDIGATNINLFYSIENLCWLYLDNGSGAENIENLWGTGTGLKIKSIEKIGNKISGELASGMFFEPDKLMYLSRCNQKIYRKHQQLNAEIHNMIALVREEGIDLTEANGKIIKGKDRLVRLPEPDIDTFDTTNVEMIKKLTKNNETIVEFLDNADITGLLKVFKFDQLESSEEKKARETFHKFIAMIDMIIDKMQFITYNTLKGFQSNITLTITNLDNGIVRQINHDVCKNNFILGRKSFENNDVSGFDDDTFGELSDNVLYITNTIYEYNGKKYNKCEIINYEELEPFWVLSSKSGYMYSKKESDKPEFEDIRNKVFKQENIKSQFDIIISFISDEEMEDQKKIMGNLVTGLSKDDLKQIYVYCNGRYLDKGKIPVTGIYERNFPNFRIAACFYKHSRDLIGPQAQKSRIDLKSSDKIFINTIESMVKPILSEFQTSSPNEEKNKRNKLIHPKGIDNWQNYKNVIFKIFKIETAQPPTVYIPQPAPTPQPTPSPQPTPTPQPAPIHPPISRGPAPTVLSSLDKKQTVSQLLRIKTKLLSPTNPYKTKGDRSKLFTKLSNIEKEIILDDDILEEKIDYLIELVQQSSKQGLVKHAAELQEI